MLLGVNMLDFYITIFNETLELMIFDRDVLGTRSYFWSNRECAPPLIVFVNVGTIPGGYVHGRPLPMYGVTKTHVPRIRTQDAPTT